MPRRLAADLRSLLEEADFNEKKAFLRSFVKRIVVDGTQAKVTYKLPPQRTSKGVREIEEVLPIVTSSGEDRIRTCVDRQVDSFTDCSD